jgi:hypothetical protein
LFMSQVDPISLVSYIQYTSTKRPSPPPRIELYGASIQSNHRMIRITAAGLRLSTPKSVYPAVT